MSQDAKEKTIALLRTTTSVLMGTDGNGLKTILYTVPEGKRCIPIMVVIRDALGTGPVYTLVGCNDVSFGTGVACGTANFLQNEAGLVDMTAQHDYTVLTTASADEYTIIDGDAAAAVDREFGIEITAGATDADIVATIDVFGYLFDS